MGSRRSLWILGQGGFLGSSLSLQATGLGFKLFTPTGISWNQPTVRKQVLTNLSQEFASFANNSEKTIIWAAGSQGVVDVSDQGSRELDSFSDFAHAVSGIKELQGSTIVIVSSAGGVYGGSANPPFSDTSDVRAISRYGQDKIAIEESARALLSELFRVHIARITNLYGPWSGPRQGLINRMCTSAASREALHIYVPLETVRDYIYVSDAAKLLLDEVNSMTDQTDGITVSVIGSGESSSIGTVIDTISHVTHRKIPLSIAQLAETQLQPRDLRVTPSWQSKNLEFSPIKLAEGVKRLFDSLVTVPRWN